MYCHVPPYTAIDSKSKHWYVLLVIWYRYIPIFAKPKSVHTALYYRRVHGGTYRYIPVYTAINQVYRIPDVPLLSGIYYLEYLPFFFHIPGIYQVYSGHMNQMVI